jgi:hypothetical protein
MMENEDGAHATNANVIESAVAIAKSFFMVRFPST